MSDKPNTLLARRLNPRVYSPALPRLRLRNGKVTQNPERILEEFAEFYSTLYGKPKQFNLDQATEFFQDISLPTLSPDQKALMDGEITSPEILRAIKSIHPFKAPGPDGLPGQYYQKLQEILAPQLSSFFNAIRKGEHLPRQENSAYIHVLPKPGKDQAYCENYRPISLINVDLKIMSKVLAARLGSFLPSKIHLDQAGFVPGRQTSDQTRRIIDIISAIHSNWDGGGQRKGMLLALDIHKAFDSLSWDYLFYTLTRMGFGSFFIQTLRTLYTAPVASLMLCL